MSVKHSALRTTALHPPFYADVVANRPATPAVGDFFYATDEKKLYGCQVAGAWVEYITLPASSLEQGDIVYYNGTAWVRLAHGTSGQALITGGHGANPAWGNVTTGTSGTFVNGDLSSGKLTVTHNLGLSAPYSKIVVVIDNNGKQVDCPITFATNSFEIDLSDFSTLSGTWGYRYI